MLRSFDEPSKLRVIDGCAALLRTGCESCRTAIEPIASDASSASAESSKSSSRLSFASSRERVRASCRLRRVHLTSLRRCACSSHRSSRRPLRPTRPGRSSAGTPGARSRRSTTCRRRGPRRSTSRGARDVPGRAWSSPIVWGDQVIVTSAVGSGRVQAAVARDLRQRLRRRAAEAGAQRSADHGEAPRARSRVAAGSRRAAVHGLQLRRQDRQGALGAAGAQGPADRRPAPQEHLRVGDAGDRRRTHLRAVRQHRPVLLRDGRQAAVDATRSIRSRAIWISGPRRRRSCTTAASTSWTTTRRARSSPRSTRRPAR